MSSFLKVYEQVITGMGRGKKKHPVKNGIAKALRTPQYKMQVAKDRRRKEILKQVEKLIREYGDE